MRYIRSLAVLAPLTLAACGTGDLTPTAPDAPREAALAMAPVCVFFNVPPLGATFGAPVGQPPGTFLFAENGIGVSTAKFFHPGGFTSYNRADIVNTPLAGFGAGKVARINNINLVFDFSGLSFVPSYVQFDWLDYGGHENLGVNGFGPFIGELDTPPAAIGPFPVNSASFAVFGGDQGKTRLTGPVQRLLVGGQEFFLDNVCAYP